jgi:hypothetical protein
MAKLTGAFLQLFIANALNKSKEETKFNYNKVPLVAERSIAYLNCGFKETF